MILLNVYTKSPFNKNILFMYLNFINGTMKPLSMNCNHVLNLSVLSSCAIITVSK